MSDTNLDATWQWSGVMNHVYHHAANGRYTVDLIEGGEWVAKCFPVPGAEGVFINRDTGNGAIDRLKVSCEFHSLIYG